MKPIRQYFPFFLLTVLLYGIAFHHFKQSTIIPPLPLNSGRQAVQLQYIEIMPVPAKQTETAVQPAEQPAEKQTAAKVNEQKAATIKLAREKLHKAIHDTAAKDDAQLKAELFAPDAKQTPDAAAESAKKSTANSPATAKKPAKIPPPVNEPEQQDSLPQQKKTKPVFKKQPATPHSQRQPQGVLQEAIVVSGNTPVYPRRAILRNQQGRVVVKLLVTSKGKGRNPQIITSSGYAILDNAVLNFIRKELFMPAHRGEKKVSSEQLFSFRFELK